MRKWINEGFRVYYDYLHKRTLRYLSDPIRTQTNVLNELIQSARTTEWGRLHQYQRIKTPDAFREQVAVQDYESLKPYIRRMMYGEKDVLWNGQVFLYSKSSGTTEDKSKFIPISRQNLRKCHIGGSWQTMMWFYHNRPDARQFEYKSLVMGGSLHPFELYPKTIIGDVSAHMIQRMPSVGKPFYTPDFKTALMSDWEEKLERMAQICAREDKMVMIGGVPTWTVILLRRILEITGKENMMEVWPHFQGYIHGGVSFLPYREQFEQFFPSENVSYQEIYNASEGFFATQNNFLDDGMLLLINNGVFYEFIPIEEWGKASPETVLLHEVERGKQYAMVISTNSGLWRYQLGDTVVFTSINPHKIKITGRTKQFVNAFGEEVMVENTDKALAMTCKKFNAIVMEYTVAPIYLEGTNRGGHEWLIEFSIPPADINAFSKDLDLNLQSLNSDYEAKRYKDIALQPLIIHQLRPGTFHDWMRRRGKLGGQHKVPRLFNNRKYVDNLMDFIANNS